MVYPILNNRRIRRFTKNIILTHSRNLKENSRIYLPIEATKNTGFYTWGIWQKYWLDDLKKEMIPCHYFVERLEQDYVIYKGLNDFEPSTYIEDLVAVGVLKQEYINSILIVINDDFTLNNFEDRWVRHLCNKLLSGFLRIYPNLDYKNIVYIDDCLTDDWEENLKYSKFEYEYTKAVFTDMQRLRLHLDKYRKK